MFRVAVKEEFCTGCFACVKICSSHVFGAKKAEDKKKAYARDPDACVGCMKCYQVCMTKAVSVVRK